MKQTICKIISTNIVIKLVFALFVSLAVSCNTSKNIENTNAKIVENDDSTTYELIVLEIGFDSWYVLQNQPSRYRSIEYYRYWNQRYISEWNFKAGRQSHSDIFRDLINYDIGEDYPFEIEHKLFHYFIFVENELKIPIIPDGPRSHSF